MNNTQNHTEKPRFVIVSAYILTYGACIGFLLFALMYFYGQGWSWINYYISSGVLAIIILLVSCLGLVTGRALLGRKKYGWMLSQFFFIFFLLKAVYGLFILSFMNASGSPQEMGLNFIMYFLIMVSTGFFLYYFNQKNVLKYFELEPEEANRVYLISFLTCAILISLTIFL